MIGLIQLLPFSFTKNEEGINSILSCHRIVFILLPQTNAQYQAGAECRLKLRKNPIMVE